MLYLLGFYMWIFVHRPHEYYLWLGVLQVERAYMLLVMGLWAFQPGKVWVLNRLHMALIYLACVMVASLALSPYINEPNFLEDYFKVLVFFTLVVTSVRTEADLKMIIQSFVIAVGLYMSHSLLEFLNGRNEWRMGIARLVGVDLSFNNPNAYCTTVLTSLPLAVAVWGRSRASAFERLMLVGYLFLSVLTVVLTGSRAGFVGLCLFALLCVLTAGRNRMVLLVVALAGLAMMMLLPGPLRDRFLSLIDSSYGSSSANASASGRLEGFFLGLELWGRSPLLGLGPVQFFAKATGREGGAHNVYGQLLSELGTLGALAFGYYVWSFWKNCREARQQVRRQPACAANLSPRVIRASAMSLILMLVLSWSGHNLYRYTWVWLAAFQASAVYCLRTGSAGRRVEPVRQVPVMRPRTGLARPWLPRPGGSWA
jgi:O-antigen ligase